MKKVIENTAYWVGILVLGIVVGVTIKMVGAWVEPGAMPPGGNIAAPLNTSNVGQSKQGGLTLNIGGATYGLIVDKGLVGIKTTTPQAELDVNGDIRAHNLNLNNNLNVGGDATINGNLNVNGTINGGGDGGGPYVAFGTNTCATGWTAAYQGVAMVAIQSWVHGGASGSTTVCKQGGDLPALNHSVGVYWQTSSSHQSTDNMPCAICIKNGPYVAFGTNTCATGWTAAYQGVAMVAVQSWSGSGAGGSSIVCKQGGDLPALNHSVGVYWQTSSSHQSTDNMPCAVCVK